MRVKHFVTCVVIQKNVFKHHGEVSQASYARMTFGRGRSSGDGDTPNLSLNRLRNFCVIKNLLLIKENSSFVLSFDRHTHFITGG